MATYLERHARGAADSMGAGADASITFRHYGATVRAGSSSARAGRCDDAEVLAQDGPCIAAMRRMRPVVLPDLVGERRWPRWRERLRTEEFGSFVAVPVSVGVRSEIAVNFYAAGARDWTDVDLATGLRLAGAVAVDVRARLRRAGDVASGDLDGRARQVQDRLDLAVGVLMQAAGCDAATAEALLRALAARRGTPPAVVADRLVAVLRRAGPDGRAGPPPAGAGRPEDGPPEDPR